MEELVLEFEAGGRVRRIWRDNPGVELFGLVELIDNNPLVCADEFSLPSAAGTLALIALGPLIRAGILVEAPTAMLTFEEDSLGMASALGRFGWDDGITAAYDAQDLGRVLGGTFMAVVVTPEDHLEIDALYEEAFGRSFCVRREEGGSWAPALVSGGPYAYYRLRYTPDEPHSLLTIQVIADRDGKCGQAQVTHAMNVMCGFEETLGIS